MKLSQFWWKTQNLFLCVSFVMKWWWVCTIIRSIFSLFCKNRFNSVKNTCSHVIISFFTFFSSSQIFLEPNDIPRVWKKKWTKLWSFWWKHKIEFCVVFLWEYYDGVNYSYVHILILLHKVLEKSSQKVF